LLRFKIVIKMLHSSDWHLGKSLFAKSLLEDQSKVLRELEAVIALEKPDLVLLAGDLYDRSIPPEDAVRLLDGFLARTILELSTPVVMIPGNHDSSTRVGVGAELLRASGLHVFSTPESVATPVRLEAGGIKTSIYAIPFLEPSEWGFHFGQSIRTHNDALNAILESLESSLAKDRNEGHRTVLVMHAYVTGGEPSESERPLSIGGSDLVSVELLKEFDYVALGHLHRPQTVYSNRIRYCGSLFPYSQSEASQPKGALIVELGKKPTDDVFTFRKFETSRGLRVIRGDLEGLLAAAAQCTPTEDYVIAVLTDQTLPFEAYRRLHQVYAGLLHVARDVNWSRKVAEDADQISRQQDRGLRESSDRDILAQFIAAAANGDLADEDRAWLVLQLEAFSKQESEAAVTT
jgi:exonuclease SbcD